MHLDLAVAVISQHILSEHTVPAGHRGDCDQRAVSFPRMWPISDGEEGLRARSGDQGADCGLLVLVPFTQPASGPLVAQGQVF